MTERRDESMTGRLRGDGLLVLFAATCVLLVCAWEVRTSALLWALALGVFAVHDLVVLSHGRRFARAAATLQAGHEG